MSSNIVCKNGFGHSALTPSKPMCQVEESECCPAPEQPTEIQVRSSAAFELAARPQIETEHA